MKHPWLAWYPGDYISKTRGLTMAEHGAYLLLLWEYYVTGPIPANAQHVLNVCLAHNEQEQVATQRVLGLFFVEKDGMYRHKRADEEIKKRELIRKERVKAGKARQQKASKCSINAQQIPTQPQSQPHIQRESKAIEPNGSRIPEDFSIDQEVRDWALAERLPNPDDEICAFVDYWIAMPGARGRKLNWKATFRTWLRRSGEMKHIGGSNGKQAKPNASTERGHQSARNILDGITADARNRTATDSPQLQVRTGGRANH